MKFKILFSFLLCFAFMSTAYASFPVKRQKQETTTMQQNASNSTDSAESSEGEYYSPAVAASDEKWVAVALWFFLWPFAAHRWYLKWSVGWNILFILTLGGLGIWAIVDVINILTDNY